MKWHLSLQATRHWTGVAAYCADVSAVVERLFATDESQIGPTPFLHKIHEERPDVDVDHLPDPLHLPSLANPRLFYNDFDPVPGSSLPSHFQKVSLLDAPAFQLPNQQNRLALVLDPVADDVPFTFGVEIFPPMFRTPPHVHDSAYEMFFIMSGSGATAFCDGRRTCIEPGDVVVFRPGCVHGIDTGNEKVYCLELLLPNEDFAEMVRRGQELSLDEDDSCILAAIGCASLAS